MKISFKYAVVTIAAITAITSASLASVGNGSNSNIPSNHPVPGNVPTYRDTKPSRLSIPVSEKNDVRKRKYNNSNSKHSKDTNPQTNKNSAGS